MNIRSRKLGDYWADFLAEHNALVSATGWPSVALHSEGRFRRPLGEGSVSLAGTKWASLDRLDSQQWAAMEGFCRALFDDFESYEPFEQFLAFKHELRRRGSGFRAKRPRIGVSEAGPPIPV
jgi:hypothetical protein